MHQPYQDKTSRRVSTYLDKFYNLQYKKSNIYKQFRFFKKTIKPILRSVSYYILKS